MPSGRRALRDRILRDQARRRLSGRERGSSDPSLGGWTRREFLRTGAIVGAGLMLTSCIDSPAIPTTMPVSTTQAGSLKVGIVGAGLAGLTAAYWLHQAGIEPVVFEASERVGGRCWTARDFVGGQVGEHGGEFIDTRHVHLRALAEALQLDLDDTWAHWDKDSTWLQIAGGEIAEHPEQYEWMQPAVDRLFAMAMQGPLGDGSGPAELVELDEMTADGWYRAEVGPLHGAEYRLWSTDLASWFGLDPDQLGAGNLIDYYTVDYPGGDERYTVSGGNDQVPARLLESLPPGTVRFGSPLEAVNMMGSNQVELTFANNLPSQSFDRVVLALPFTTLRDVDIAAAGFTNPMKSAIDALAMGTNAKILLQLDRPMFTGFDDWSGSLTRADNPRFETWESGSTDGSGNLGLLTIYTGGRAGASYHPVSPHGPAPSQVIERALAAIEPAVAGVTDSFNGEAWLDSWVDDPWSRGSYAAFGPGQITRFWGALSEAQGQIHIAGEHTSTFSQGFLNGGVESGYRVAVEILKSAGVVVPPAMRQILRRAKKFAPIGAY